MKFLVIADLHGNVSVLDKLDGEFSSCDAVLFGGDFADAVNKLPGEPVLKKLVSKHSEIYAVLGNHDDESFIDDLEKEGINAQGVLLTIPAKEADDCPLLLAGSGGSTPFTRDTPYERDEADIMSDLDIITTNAVSAGGNCDSGDFGEFPNLIVISHNPPRDTKCDLAGGKFHAGSAMLRSFIEKTKPLAVVTAHIHEAVAIDKVGGTTIINPGSLGNAGAYAVMTIEKVDGAPKVVSAELKRIV